MQRWRRQWHSAAFDSGPNADRDYGPDRDRRSDGKTDGYRTRFYADAHPGRVRFRKSNSYSVREFGRPIAIVFGDLGRAGHFDSDGAALRNPLHIDAESGSDANADSAAYRDPDDASDALTDADAGFERLRCVQ